MNKIEKESFEELPEPYNEEEKMNIKKEIQLPKSGKLISEFIYDIIGILNDKNILFYRNDIRQIVEVGRIKHNTKEEQSFSGFIPVKSGRFITMVEKFFVPGNNIMIKEGDDYFPKFKEKSMTKDLSNTILESYILEETLPAINRIFIIPMPILPNGSLTFPKVGYDSRFKSWLAKDSPRIEKPDMSLEEAKEIFNKILKEFCFQSKEDCNMALAGLITPFLRGLYHDFNCRTPVFLYLGNRERVGKDYLAGLSGLIYEGVALEEPPLSVATNKGNADEELRKKILSALISGRKRLHFANNKGNINNSVFEGIVTATTYSDRILGRNESPIFDNELEFSLSGNVGIGFTADLANRSRMIRLFYDQEDTNARVFTDPNLHKWVLDNRGLILSAIYSLVKNWVDKGKMDGKVPFTSFPEWARVCGGIMEAAGYDSPCLSNKGGLALGGDSETTDMKLLFENCYEKFPNEPLTKAEIRCTIGKEDILSYLDFTKKSDQIKFGKKMVRFVGRILSDIKMSVEDDSVRSSRQKYIFTKEKSTYDKQNSIKGGKVGNVGNVLVTDEYKSYSLYNTVGSTLPTLPTLPKTYGVLKDTPILADPTTGNNLGGWSSGTTIIMNNPKIEKILISEGHISQKTKMEVKDEI